MSGALYRTAMRTLSMLMDKALENMSLNLFRLRSASILENYRGFTASGGQRLMN